MPRYEIQEKRKGSKVNINGSLNPTKLQENGIDVLTASDIANSLSDGVDKVPSLKLLKQLMESLNITGGVGNGSGNGNVSNVSKNEILSLISSILMKNYSDNISKEKGEVTSRSNILIDANITPELVGDEVRSELIKASNEYTEKCIEIYEYIKYLLENNYTINDKIEESLNNQFEQYKIHLTNISKSTQNATNRLAQIKSDITLEEANKHTDTIANQIVYKLEIHSTNGSMFKKGTIDTTLNAVLYKGKEEITETFLPIRFVWTRKSNDVNSDDIWNSSARRDYSIKITNKDMVGSQCTFNCTVLDDNGNKLVSAF